MPAGSLQHGTIDMRTLFVVLVLRLVVLPSYPSPLGEIVLRRDGLHFPVQTHNILAQLRALAGIFRLGRGQLRVDSP